MCSTRFVPFPVLIIRRSGKPIKADRISQPENRSRIKAAKDRAAESSNADDRVFLHGELGQIEFVVDPADNPDDWYVTKHGGGVMVVEARVFGRLFIPAPANYEDVKFASRSEGGEGNWP